MYDDEFINIFDYIEDIRDEHEYSIEDKTYRCDGIVTFYFSSSIESRDIADAISDEDVINCLQTTADVYSDLKTTNKVYDLDNLVINNNTIEIGYTGTPPEWSEYGGNYEG